MRPSRRVLLLFAPLLPLLLAALAVLGFVALKQASSLGRPEFWLMAWTVGFVVGLPCIVVALGVAGAWPRHRRLAAIIPNAGGKIPGTGQ
jgi:hypothetical protein